MFHPIVWLGLAVAGGLALKRATQSGPVTDASLIDASEKTHPAAETARKAIANAMQVNSLTLYEMTAVAIETQLRMPKTAANLRAFALRQKQGGNVIAGDEDDGGDEVGARRRRRRRKHRAKRPAVASSSANAPAPLVDWSSANADDGEDDDEEEDEVGASSGKRPLPDWLKFAATQSMLAGDPKLITATALVMRRMGWHRHADIHLQALGALPR